MSPLSRGISTEWLKGLPQKDQTEFKKILRGNTFLLSRLRGLLEAKLDTIQKLETKLDTYDAGYPYKQAFLNGKKDSLQEVKNLLSFLDQET